MRAAAMLVVTWGVLAAGPAHADQAPPPDDDAEPALLVAPPSRPAAADPRDHARQVGLAVQLPIGLRAIKTYDDEYCGSLDDAGANAPACVGRAPQTLDLTLSYGVRPRLEAMLELRLGLEADVGATAAATGPRVFHLAPGVRVFYSDARTTKLFATAQVVFDLTGHDQLGTDVGIRNVNGLWFDRHAQWGWFLFVGETLSFTRWIRVELEAGVGVQGRLP